MPLAAVAGSSFGKYFLHGLAFAVLFFIVGIAWVLITVVLVICGLFLGLAIGVVLFFVFMGYVNSFVTEALWFPVKTGFLSCLGHGFLLFLVFIPLNLIILAIQAFVTPNLAVSFIVFLVTAPISGFLAKGVAGLWRVEPSQVPVAPPPPVPGVDSESAAILSHDYTRK